MASEALTAIQDTADDAISGKLSAASLGYINDPYLVHFAKHVNGGGADRSKGGRGPPPPNIPRRPPIINRGNFARVSCVEKLIREFLGDEHLTASTDAPQNVQIVSLGAGQDTSFFRLQRDGIAPTGGYFEVDFHAVLEKKVAAIRRAGQLRSVLGDSVVTSDGRVAFTKEKYHLISADLSNATGTIELLRTAGVNFSAPTLFIAECVLVYMDPSASTALLEALGNSFECAVFASYDMINPNDAFGKVMVANIAARGCSLPGYAAFATLQSQEERFLRAGWEHARATDMLTIYNQFLDRSEVQRVARIEPLDEVEEWDLIMTHYCFVVASRGAAASAFFKSLRLEEFSTGETTA